MKALLIIQDFLPGLPGGIANYVYRLCHELAPDLEALVPVYGDARSFDAGQPFAIHRRRIPVEPPAFMRESRWHLLRMPIVATIAAAQLLLFLWHGLRLGRQRKIRVILIGHLYLAPVGWLLGRLLRVPYGVILYGGELHRYFGWRPVRLLLVAALDRARFLVTITEFARQQVLRRGVRPDQTFLTVYPGVDPDRFRPGGDGRDVRERYGLTDKRVILTVARLVDWKGHDLVLRALPRVLAAAPDAHYLIAGDGPYRAELERLVRELGLDAHVTFAGFVPDAGLPACYAAADLFVQPSREAAGNTAIEGFGITYVEAGACGLPVIGGRTGGTGEAIIEGVTGLRVDPYDAGALAAVILSLLQDPAYARRLGDEGRARAVREFAWPGQTARLKAFLAGLEGA
jgi:phosphatidylinositol alpha-1,6-mannosyltransferase